MPFLKACSTAEAPETPQQSPWLSHLGWHGSAGAQSSTAGVQKGLETPTALAHRNCQRLRFENEQQRFLTSCPQGSSNETRSTNAQSLHAR